MKRIKVLASLLSLLLCHPAFAGNTHDKTAQTETTKQTERPLVASFFGGLMLTKICLENQHSLSPYAEQVDEDYTERCEKLTGLVIFHTGNEKSQMDSGMYVWDGKKWQQASFEYKRARVEGLGEQK